MRGRYAKYVLLGLLALTTPGCDWLNDILCDLIQLPFCSTEDIPGLVDPGGPGGGSRVRPAQIGEAHE